VRTVELIYDPSCPNVGEARKELELAFSELKLTARWTEWDVTDPKAPERVRSFGSPTVLVDGRDVSGQPPATSGATCRVYQGSRRAPPADMIAAALTGEPPAWRASFAIAPAVLTSLLPNLACPACWPAYAGVVSSLGLGFLLDSAYLLPITGVFLSVAVVALGLRAKSRRGFGPLAIGLVSAVLILLGKFALDSDVTMGVGIALLVLASIWNSWPRRTPASCASCE
jgi:mercuric ion transport protein